MTMPSFVAAQKHNLQECRLEDFMKRLGILSVVCSVLLIGLLDSCVSLQDKTMTQEERAESEVIGAVTTTFNSFHLFHMQDEENIKSKAYAQLKEEAQKKYSGNIDVKNITIAGGMSGWNVLWGALTLFSPIVFDIQKITASGDVVQYSSSAGVNQAAQRKLGAAVSSAGTSLIDSLPQGATIAILSVNSSDISSSELVISELEYKLVESGKFTIVDRRRLDQIRSEQNFQMSGDVNDDSAVSIGNMLGASIVITGEIIGSETTSQRLVLKALDVKTAQIITMAREEF
jgi:hypothetical protein